MSTDIVAQNGFPHYRNAGEYGTAIGLRSLPVAEIRAQIRLLQSLPYDIYCSSVRLQLLIHELERRER